MENMRKIEHNKINTETTKNGLNKEVRTTRQYTRTARILHPYNINSYILTLTSHYNTTSIRYITGSM